jgi:release factor glutamine methyltransferase
MSTFEYPSTSSIRLPSLAARLQATGGPSAEEEVRLLVETAGRESPADQSFALDELVRRRAEGEPLERVIGRTSFRGLPMEICHGVFVPRRRTEYLVARAVALAGRRSSTPLVLLDLCCGSGAVGVATATELAAAGHECTVHCADIDPVATACARRNAEGLDAHVYTGDLYDPLPGSLARRIDVITASAPYLPAEAIPLLQPETRLYEPAHALDGGVDGLTVLRRVIAGAPSWLAAGGHLLVETGRGQLPAVAELMVLNGLRPHVATSDELDATVVEGTHA